MKRKQLLGKIVACGRSCFIIVEKDTIKLSRKSYAHAHVHMYAHVMRTRALLSDAHTAEQQHAAAAADVLRRA